MSIALNEKNKAKNNEPYAHSLDAINFLLADVRGALGPYLNVFLVTQQHWSQSQVGMVTTIAGLLGLVVKTPIGGMIDTTHSKREAIILALVVLAAGAIIIFAFPAVSALTLGIYPRSKLASRIGRNSALDHAGNVAIAFLAGIVGYLFSQRAVFLLVPIGAAFATLAVLSIPASAIDHARASGLENESKQSTSAAQLLLKSRPLIIFSLCAMLFHFANPPLLPLVGQKLAYANPFFSSLLWSCPCAHSYAPKQSHRRQYHPIDFFYSLPEVSL